MHCVTALILCFICLLSIHPSIHQPINHLVSLSLVRLWGMRVPISSSQWARGGKHPGQVASPSQFIKYHMILKQYNRRKNNLNWKKAWVKITNYHFKMLDHYFISYLKTVNLFFFSGVKNTFSAFLERKYCQQIIYFFAKTKWVQLFLQHTVCLYA